LRWINTDSLGGGRTLGFPSAQVKLRLMQRTFHTAAFGIPVSQQGILMGADVVGCEEFTVMMKERDSFAIEGQRPGCAPFNRINVGDRCPIHGVPFLSVY